MCGDSFSEGLGEKRKIIRELNHSHLLSQQGPSGYGTLRKDRTTGGRATARWINSFSPLTLLHVYIPKTELYIRFDDNKVYDPKKR